MATVWTIGCGDKGGRLERMVNWTRMVAVKVVRSSYIQVILKGTANRTS